MMTDPIHPLFMLINNDWVELPSTIYGHRIAYHIPPAIAQAAGDTYTIRDEFGEYEFTPLLPNGAIITKAMIELTRSPFSGGWAYRWVDSDE